MSIIITDEVKVDRSSEFDQTARHNHSAAACFRCAVDGLGHEGDCDDVSPHKTFIASSDSESLPFVSKTREAMIADVVRLNRDLIAANQQLRDARELVRQTQEDMSEVCGLYARCGIDLQNAAFRIEKLKTFISRGLTINIKDLATILNKSDAEPERSTEYDFLPWERYHHGNMKSDQ